MNKVKQNGKSVLISMLTVSPNQKYLIFIFDSVVLLAGLIPPCYALELDGGRQLSLLSSKPSPTPITPITPSKNTCVGLLKPLLLCKNS